MKKIILFFFVFFILSQNTAYASNLNIAAQGAVLIDSYSGRVLYGKNENEPLAMASTTKIMTAIIALENGNLDDIVTVSKNATKAPEVKMHLKENEEVKLEYLMYALMLQSYNDAAIAIAEHISGDVETFCELMTQKAKEIGANDTVFRTPNGLDEQDHHSTAYDMALIARYACKNEEFMKIINTSSISFESNLTNYTLTNKNRLLNEYEGANGVKTGYTNKAGQCFVGSAVRDDMMLISVVLGSGWGSQGKEQKWVDTKTLLDYGFNNYYYKKILSKTDCTEHINVINGEEDFIPLYFSQDIMLPICKEEEDKINIQLDYIKTLEAPVDKNEKVGIASVYIDDELVSQVDILTLNSVEKKDFSSYMYDIFNNWLNILQ